MSEEITSLQMARILKTQNDDLLNELAKEKEAREGWKESADFHSQKATEWHFQATTLRSELGEARKELKEAHISLDKADVPRSPMKVRVEEVLGGLDFFAERLEKYESELQDMTELATHNNSLKNNAEAELKETQTELNIYKEKGTPVSKAIFDRMNKAESELGEVRGQLEREIDRNGRAYDRASKAESEVTLLNTELAHRLEVAGKALAERDEARKAVEELRAMNLSLAKQAVDAGRDADKAESQFTICDKPGHSYPGNCATCYQEYYGEEKP